MVLFFQHKKGISSYVLADHIKVQQKTAWLLQQKIRYSVSEDKELIGSLKGLIEVDETFVGGKNKNRHHAGRVAFRNGQPSLVKSIVFGMLEVNRKLIKVFVIKNRDGDTLHPLIKANIEEQSHIVSDDWVAYNGLEYWYYRTIVNHSAGQYTNGYFHTNTIEAFWSRFKKAINSVHHSVSKRYLQRYCDDHAFRYNNSSASTLDKIGKVIISSQNKRLKHYECTIKLAA